MRTMNKPGRLWRSRQRLCGGALVAVAVLLLAGCGGTVTGTAATGTNVSVVSTSAAQPELILDIEFAGESAAPADADLVSSISAILGDVDELPSAQSVGSDVYVGMANGRYRVWVALPGATAEQLDAARLALIGTRKFGLRPVTAGAVDAKGCATVQAVPNPERLCDADSQEVLTLGTDLGLLPTRVEVTAGQETQAATLTFSAADARTIATFTAAHVGERLAVTDGLVLVTAPTIQSSITTGDIAISGDYSTARAAALVGRLQLAAVGATISSGS